MEYKWNRLQISASLFTCFVEAAMFIKKQRSWPPPTWTVWSSCSVTCGTVKRERTRSCDMPITEAIKYTCFQQDTETDKCSQPPCTAACVNSCRELVDGNYQSCQTCEGYVSCIDKELYSRSCPGQLVWDDRERKCAEYSTTCSHLTTRSEDEITRTTSGD